LIENLTYYRNGDILKDFEKELCAFNKHTYFKERNIKLGFQGGTLALF